MMIQLDQRQLGASGIVVPALGVGIWSWGDTRFWNYGKDYTREDIMQAYRACLDAGLNFVDIAEIYGSGESERILGACRRADEGPIMIGSKFAPIGHTSSRALLKSLYNSLQRPKFEQTHLYQ